MNSIKEVIKILHITPHLGGGVGKVIINYLIRVKKYQYLEHEIACLDYANNVVLRKAKINHLKLKDKMFNHKNELLKLISSSDIILIHWWNHPLLYDFLVRKKLPPCRVIIWSHISGLYPPSVFTKKILTYPNLFVFTTPISIKTKEVKHLTSKQQKLLKVVWAAGGVDEFHCLKPKKHEGFNIGYIGTVDYAKLHPDFVDICSKIKMPDVKFIVCGGPSEKTIKEEVRKLGISDRFIFTGKVNDIAKYLMIFDVFGYPLAPHHYGTCDQSLAESMTAGVVPVVLDNKMEKHMVIDGVTGFVSKDKEDYVRNINKLYKNKALRERLSKNAKKYAVKYYSLDKMINRWNIIFKKIMLIPKSSKKWDLKERNIQITAMKVFLESLGDYGKEFKLYLNTNSNKERKQVEEKLIKYKKDLFWTTKTRGTVFHYKSFFPDDNALASLNCLLMVKQ
ncbi:MAG: glycosyltransferase family 4 protein [Nanoarchaeota archaeon]|nr:glycosyltransferase family 4 protein [Nanoarchaeota archaeon]